MNKAQPAYHQGIEYVRLSSLPFLQYQQFVNWISPLSVFHLSEKEDVMDDCVSYSEYDQWYELNVKETFVELKYSF